MYWILRGPCSEYPFNLIVTMVNCDIDLNLQVAQNSGLNPFKSHLVKLNDSTGLDLSDFSTEDPSTPPTCQSCIEANCGGDRVAGRPWLRLPHCPKEQQWCLAIDLDFQSTDASLLWSGWNPDLPARFPTDRVEKSDRHLDGLLESKLEKSYTPYENVPVARAEDGDGETVDDKLRSLSRFCKPWRSSGINQRESFSAVTSIAVALCGTAGVSSLRDRPLPQDLVVFGEVGLAGEIRPVPIMNFHYLLELSINWILNKQKSFIARP